MITELDPLALLLKLYFENGCTRMSLKSCLIGYLSSVFTPLLATQGPFTYQAGHVGGFFMNNNQVIEKARKYFNSRAPFTLTVGGEPIIIITSATDVAEVWKSTQTFSMDPISKDMWRWVGVSTSHIDPMFEPQPEARYWRDAGLKKALSPVEMLMELHRRQLYGGASGRLEVFMRERLGPELETSFSSLKNVAVEVNGGSHPALLAKESAYITVSLFKLSCDLNIRGLTTAYFGPVIYKLQSEILEHFLVWEYTNWKYLYQVPGAFSRDMLAAKKALVDAFTGYFEMEESERGEMVYFVKECEELFKEMGLSTREMGGIMMLHYWAMIGNIYKISFWLLSHLLLSPDSASLISTIRNETAPALSPTNSHQINAERLTPEQCPTLHALFNEVLRLTVTSSLGRVATTDTVVGGKTVRKGTKVLIPFRELHYNPSAFGPAPERLSPNRFNDNPKLAKSSNFRPWGGGNHLCPGRFLAWQLIATNVALLVGNWDLDVLRQEGAGGRKGRMDQPNGFPKGDEGRPSPGVTPVAEGEDLFVKLMKRERGMTGVGS
ncbi:cytochrome P450 [Delitschia confertaspora ATCC 74209]|uniref:Cytochrome P450 n=1 Tax=Delitschia confertaspora ATCC 74209 TaxID=1513339 RepID=A0A9P4MZW6_9PLEO|nr:cytochrome P450 [Delitschia confertaspora ATCC 74209]